MWHFFSLLPPLLPLFPPSVTRCLTGRCGSWQTGFVTCSKSVTADCTGLILTNSHIEWVESLAPLLHGCAVGGDAALSRASKTEADSSTSPRYVLYSSASGQTLALHVIFHSVGQGLRIVSCGIDQPGGAWHIQSGYTHHMEWSRHWG